jgi:hypothetical protein
MFLDLKKNNIPEGIKVANARITSSCASQVENFKTITSRDTAIGPPRTAQILVAAVRMITIKTSLAGG